MCPQNGASTRETGPPPLSAVSPVGQALRIILSQISPKSMAPRRMAACGTLDKSCVLGPWCPPGLLLKGLLHPSLKDEVGIRRKEQIQCGLMGFSIRSITCVILCNPRSYNPENRTQGARCGRPATPPRAQQDKITVCACVHLCGFTEAAGFLSESPSVGEQTERSRETRWAEWRREP